MRRNTGLSVILLPVISAVLPAHAESTDKVEQHCPGGYILLNPGDNSTKPQTQWLAGVSGLTLKSGNAFSMPYFR